MATTPNQSFLLKNMELQVAACLAGMIHEFSDACDWKPGAWSNPHSLVFYATGWNVKDQVFALRANPGTRSKLVTVQFSGARWDPNASNITYGPKKIAQNVEVNEDAKTKIIRNETDDTIHVAYEESVELTNSFSTSVTKGMTLDITATSETTVSGEYAGVSAEEKVTTSMGVSTSSEESKEQSEEGTNAESLSIEFEAKPRSYYMITISKEHQTSYQDFDANGVMDFDLQMRLQGNHGGRLGKHYPGNYVELKGIDGLKQFCMGYDTNHPQMQGYWGSTYSRAKNGLNWIFSPSNRQMTVGGTNQASLESNADYKVELLGSSLPEALAHLPVVDAEDV